MRTHDSEQWWANHCMLRGTKIGHQSGAIRGCNGFGHQNSQRQSLAHSSGQVHRSQDIDRQFIAHLGEMSAIFLRRSGRICRLADGSPEFSGGQPNDSGGEHAGAKLEERLMQDDWI